MDCRRAFHLRSGPRRGLRVLIIWVRCSSRISENGKNFMIFQHFEQSLSPTSFSLSLLTAELWRQTTRGSGCPQTPGGLLLNHAWQPEFGGAEALCRRASRFSNVNASNRGSGSASQKCRAPSAPSVNLTLLPIFSRFSLNICCPNHGLPNRNADCLSKMRGCGAPSLYFNLTTTFLWVQNVSKWKFSKCLNSCFFSQIARW